MLREIARQHGKSAAQGMLRCHLQEGRSAIPQESMMQAIRATRPGGSVGYVGVPHGVSLDGADVFFRHVRLLGGPAPVRRYLPQLIDLVFAGKINPGKV
jgi:threonine dehydrogenase-like Zn-dependent dehydrogenase